MRLQIPIIYQATVIPFRARAPRAEYFHEHVDVELREITDYDAPIAIRWKDKYNGNNLDGICELRWFEDKLWMPVVYQYSGRPNTHWTLESAIETLREGNGGPLLSGIDWHYREYRSRPPLDPAAFRVVEHTNREEQIQKVYEHIGSKLVIDGKLWTQAKEPVYAIDRSAFRREVWISIKNAPEGDESRKHVFRIDRLDDAVAYAGGKTDEEIEHLAVDILIPEAVRYDDETPALLEGLQAEVIFSQDKLKEMSKEVAMVWFDLRDATATAAYTRDPEDVEKAVEVARKWMEVGRIYLLPSTLDRWDNRPVRLDFGNGFSPEF